MMRPWALVFACIVTPALAGACTKTPSAEATGSSDDTDGGEFEAGTDDSDAADEAAAPRADGSVTAHDSGVGVDSAAADADNGDAGDAAVGRCDRTKPFGAPVLVTAVNSSADESSARLSPDELSLYLGSSRKGTYDMFIATRANVSADFSAPTTLAGLDTPNNESHGVVSADGLTMYLGFAKGGQPFQIAVSTRSTIVADFGAPQLVANINSNAADNDPMLDDAMLTIYFTSTRAANNVDIYRATRTAGGAFGAPATVPEIDTASDEHMPVITPDDLTLYFASNRAGAGTKGRDDIWVAHRAAVDKPFDAPVLVAELNGATDDAPTWVSSDDCTIYVRRATGGAGTPHDIWVASRPK